MTAPGRGVITHTSPSSHFPSDLYRPPQVWLTTRAHSRQQPHGSGIVPLGQSTTDGQSCLSPQPGHWSPTTSNRWQPTANRDTKALTKFDDIASTCHFILLNSRSVHTTTGYDPLKMLNLNSTKQSLLAVLSHKTSDVFMKLFSQSYSLLTRFTGQLV